jgi:DNA polymerase-3 subunit beta
VEFEVDRDAFADAVAWTARGLPARPVVPVTAGVLLDVADGALTVSGFDFEVLNRITLPVTEKDAGRALVSGRLLAEIAKALPPKDVRVTAEGNRLTVRCGSSRFALPLMQVEDYPQVPTLPPRSGTVRGEVFAAAVAQVTAAASKDETLPMLTGVRVEIGLDTLVFAATDRYRLAERDLPWTPSGEVPSGPVVIPAKTLSEAAKALGSASEVELAIGGDTGFIGFSAGGKQTLTRMLDGDFPKFDALWPKEQLTTAEVEVGPLLEAVKRVSLVAQRYAPVRMMFEDGSVALSAEAEDESSADEELPVLVSGEPLTIGFNAGYLIDGLSAVRTPRALLSFSTSAKPGVITPIVDPAAGGEAGGPDGSATDGSAKDGTDPGTGVRSYRYLVMSMRLRG